MEQTLHETSSLPSITLDAVASGVISTVIYFDIFNYPLTLEEIKFNCHTTPATEDAIGHAVNELIGKGLLFHNSGFYMLTDDASLAQRRKTGNALSEKLMVKAKRYSSFISSFPFVRSVCLSGSLSKGYMDKDADIDYFIICKPGRLWVCRTFLVAFKKIFLLNSKKYFCVNYFVDEDNLVIPDKNIFTATEISFIIPTYNYELYHRLIMENSWCREYYPNKKITRDAENMGYRNGVLKRFLEWTMNGRLGERLDTFLFKLTLKRWKKKFSGFDASVFDVNMRSKKNVSKHHPQGFQFRVLSQFSAKKEAFEKINSISLSA